MKPVKTWIILANAETGRFFVNSGRGKGLEAAGQEEMHADPPRFYSDRAGAVHSRVGPGVSAVEQSDPKDLAETEFADAVCDYLQRCFEDDAFEKLIVIAGPRMLGKLRKAMPDGLAKTVVAEMDKDLTRVPIKDLPHQLRDVIAV